MPVVPRVGPPAGVVGASFLCLASFLFLSAPPARAGGTPAYRIVVNLPSRTLSLYAGADLVRRYPVAIGHPDTPSPVGRYRIAVKVVNPTWYPKRRPPVPPGPLNPVGTRWLGLNVPDLGLHGTNDPASIGQAVSGGCIRLHNADVEELFSLVGVDTPVEFTYETVEVRRLPADDWSAGPADEAALLYSYALTIHPDVYRRGRTTAAQAREVLLGAGITAELDRARLERQAREARGTLEPLPVVPRVVIAGRPARRVAWEEGRLWLPLNEAAELLGTPLLAWEGMLRERGGEAWVAATEVAWRRGYRVKALPAAATLYLTTPLVFWNDQPIARAFSAQDGVLVPLEPLAQACGRRVAVDPCLAVAVSEGGRTVPVQWRGEEAYLAPLVAAGLFALEVSVTEEGVRFAERSLEQPGEQLRGQLDL
ncbi:MAG: L,D-transpeptidase [Bacillota bacterium]|nr:L,D-transpeptidase [Bacillota bacterium]